MKIPAFALLLSALAIAPPSPLAAQDGPVGIGFAQAEEGTWWCRDQDPGQALACAAQKCKTESGGQDCHPTRWCSPAGWSGLMTVWLPEFHATTPLCGVSGETALIAGFQALCAGSPDVTRCDLTLIIDPDGNETEITDASWEGPAVASPEAEAPELPQAGQPETTEPPAARQTAPPQ
jgi:hypothetical protein